MPVEFKDYYRTLGVSRTASADEIRKAFRSLARQYHPDVAKDKKRAEEKFKEINEAYEVLGDAEKRKKYDTMNADWEANNYASQNANAGYRSYARRPSPSSQPNEDFEFRGTGFSDFFERFFGGSGSFGHRNAFSETEPTRGGDVEADIMVTLQEAMEGGVRPITLRRSSDCSTCGGTGTLGRRVCPTCGGKGYQSVLQRYRVKIPSGVHDGQRLRIAGQGEPGENGGPSGDLYLRVRMASHPDFRVEGKDLFHDLELAPWEAVLGASVVVPTVNGSVSIKIPAGTQNGQRLRVRGHGLPSVNGENGDLYVVARIALPSGLSEREKSQWQELARVSSFNPRT